MGVGGTRYVIFEATSSAPCVETFQMVKARGAEGSHDFEARPGSKVSIAVLPELVTFKQASEENTIPAGKMGALELFENASTGYSWKIKEEDHNCVKLVDSTYEVPEQDTSNGQMMQVGVSGKRTMYFDVIGE